MNAADEINARVPMLEVAQRYGIGINRAGYACCPFHTEKTPSLRVYPGAGGWYCYGCHKGGDVIDFTREYFGLTYPQTLVRLNDDFALGLPIGRKLTAKERRAAEQARMAREREAQAWATQWQEAYREWQQAFDRWLALEQLRETLSPKRMGDPFTAAYAYTMYKLPEARYEVERTEDALLEIETQRRAANERSA